MRREFQAYGEVVSVIIVKNKLSGVPMGSAFIEMLKTSEGLDAVLRLNGKILNDRIIAVKTSRNWSELRKSSPSQQQKPRKA